eukprot:Nk52_evm22s164 gene=Nk52_evmTU22s164
MNVDYLKTEVMASLRKGLVSVAEKRPTDPIDYLGKFLMKEHENIIAGKQKVLDQIQIEKEKLDAEEMEKLNAERAKEAELLKAEEEREKQRILKLKNQQRNQQASQEFILKMQKQVTQAVRVRNQEVAEDEEKVKVPYTPLEILKLKGKFCLDQLKERYIELLPGLLGDPEHSEDCQFIIKSVLYLLGNQKVLISEWKNCLRTMCRRDLPLAIRKYRQTNNPGRMVRSMYFFKKAKEDQIQSCNLIVFILYEYLKCLFPITNMEREMNGEEPIDVDEATMSEDDSMFEVDCDSGFLELSPLIDTSQKLNEKIQINISWKGVDEAEVDMDASAILFDSNGFLVDSVYYNQLKSKDGSIEHKGDEGDSAEGDESIIFTLPEIPANICFIAVALNSNKEDVNFSNVESITGSVLNEAGDSLEINFQIGGKVSNSTMLMCMLFRDLKSREEWRVKATGEACPEVADEALKHMLAEPVAVEYADAIGLLDPPSLIFHASSNPMELQKGHFSVLPSNTGSVCIGWQVNKDKKVGIDCTCVVFENDKNVDFINQENAGTDKVFTVGEANTNAGDLEQFDFDVSKLKKTITSVIFVLCVYSGGSLKDLSNVHMRFLDNDKIEHIRYFEPTVEKNDCLGCILGKLQKTDLGWAFTALGSSGDGASYLEMLPMIKRYTAIPLSNY